ncbi:SpoIIIAH-like family protein [Paenibacillus sp. JX-17]|uniref:SpoIIIAH-like family protein n=1 Tax=Paenibacillus lacisoli TaxID=3064525 RepID=A0ABT9C9A0_9BACL|nr:SpoIIIAH-like family protein [Paenibacillus sp. JX-17]MDO7905168.1 SpoIIIAH-like family protein [Paenibacillus sp. JX-17]
MNNKRQTIWLVSMLSLMVVLSAYYLFTEDSGPAKTPVAGSQQQDTKAGAAGQAGDKESADGLVVNEVVTGDAAEEASGESDSGAADKSQASSDSEGQKAPAQEPANTDPGKADSKDSSQQSEDSTSSSASGAGDKETAADAKDQAAAGGAKTDDQVLKELEDDNAAKPVTASAIDQYLFERDQSYNEKTEELSAAMADMSKNPEDSAKVEKELQALEEKQSKITNIEEELKQKYANAVVREEANEKYNVVVISDKLDAKQAVGIIDLVIKELKVPQDKISVQHVKENSK